MQSKGSQNVRLIQNSNFRGREKGGGRRGYKEKERGAGEKGAPIS